MQLVGMLVEARVEWADIGDTKVRVWVNPTHTDFQAILRTIAPDHTLRGTLDTSGNLYVWDAVQAIHSQIRDALGVGADGIEHEMMIEPGSVTLDYEVDEDAFRAIPAIQRLYGPNDGFDILNDGMWQGDDEDDR